MAPSSLERDRWLALVLLLGAMAISYLVLVHPWWTAPLLQVDRELQQSLERDLRVRTQLRQAPEVQARLLEVRAALQQRPGFLTESSAELATAGLVKRLETVVLEASPGNRSCAITQRAPIAQPPGEIRFAAVVVQVRLQCGAAELGAVLHALESGSPRLFVDNLNVLRTHYAFQAAPGDPSQNGLDVSFDLYGYLRPAAVAAPQQQATAQTPQGANDAS